MNTHQFLFPSSRKNQWAFIIDNDLLTVISSCYLELLKECENAAFSLRKCEFDACEMMNLRSGAARRAADWPAGGENDVSVEWSDVTYPHLTLGGALCCSQSPPSASDQPRCLTEHLSRQIGRLGEPV